MTEPTAGASEMAARLRRVVGLDVDAGLSFVGNSLDVYLRLLQRFVQLHEADMAELVRRAESADCALLTRVAHAIKGGAATLGMTGLAGVAQQLEQETRDGGAAGRVLELAQLLQANYTDLSRQLAQACGDEPSGSGAGRAGSAR